MAVGNKKKREKQKEMGVFLLCLVVVVVVDSLDDPFQKVYSDGLFIVTRENALAESLYHARLADSTISNNDDLSK